VAFEALLRSDEPLMKSPADMLDAAERLGRLPELGRAVRAHLAAAAPDAPEGVKLFVNLHSVDLNDEELYSRDAPLSRIASRVVLEVTERASLYGVDDGLIEAADVCMSSQGIRNQERITAMLAPGFRARS
jgi:EAL domain-containing protein (putative c-di-GMP-specific phosphodiesterase class I)